MARNAEGDAKPMSNSKRFAIITPYYKETREVLERCVGSVKRQTIAADHFLVSDGFPQDWLDGADVRHIRLGQEHHDYGNTPRGLGALLAVAEKYDGIGLLDADNFVDSHHVEECCSAADSVPGTSADLVIARRRILLADCTPTNLLDEPGHIGTGCFWFLEGSYHLIHYWSTMPKQMAVICDRVFWGMIQAQPLTVRHTQRVAVNYVSSWEYHYRASGKSPPPGAKPNVDFAPIFDWVRSLDNRQLKLVKELCGIDPLILIENGSLLPRPVARNEPCFCGSGRKYKNCHGKWLNE